MMNQIVAIILTLYVIFSSGCNQIAPTSDQRQNAQQERILQEGVSQVGMPAVKNFRERKLVKDLIELRDQENLVTYTYIVAENTGKYIFVCDSIGYGVPAAVQFTSPQRVATWHETPEHGNVTLPQADPNGLFSPASAEGTWVMCADPEQKGKTVPVYLEPRIVVSPFKLTN